MSCYIQTFLMRALKLRMRFPFLYAPARSRTEQYDRLIAPNPLREVFVASPSLVGWIDFLFHLTDKVWRFSFGRHHLVVRPRIHFVAI